jgi:outer membrane lipase/esterase
VQTLGAAGARHILVVNVPDIGLTPLALATGNGAGFSLLVSIYNQNLDLALDQLARAGIRTIRLKSDVILQNMVAHPDEYGFTNVTLPYLLAGGAVDDYLFFDALHPTTGGHTVLADGAVKALVDYYSPRKSGQENRGMANALNGLVRARTLP